MNLFSRSILGLLLIFFFLGTAIGQGVSSVQLVDVRPDASGNVQVLATVVDDQGRRIDGLSAANFSASIGQKHAQANSLERTNEGNAPLSVILLLDTSGSMSRSVAALRDAASAFVEQLGPDDSCSLITFGDGVKTISSFTTDKRQLLSSIKTIQARESKTYLYQALDDALNQAAVSPLTRSVVVVLTDGRDEGSALTIDDVNKKIEQVRVPVYTLGLGAEADTAVLRRLAAISHGGYFEAPSAEDLKGTYLSILDNLKSVYRIGFTFPSLEPGQNELQLTVSLRGASATARKAFVLPRVTEERNSQSGQITKWPWLAILAVSLLLITAGLAWFYLRRRKKSVPDLAATVVPPKVWFDVLDGVHAGEKLLLFEESNTIGRDVNASSVCLARDPLVGRVHARVFRNSRGQYLLEDLGSQNGTRVNDITIREPIVLQSGDKISIGMSQLRFTDNR